MCEERRTKLTLSTLAAVLLLGAQSAPARAQTRCPVGPFPPFVPDGTTTVVGTTRAGQPCQMGFGVLGGTVQELRITERPLHGVLGMAAQEENRRFIAYAPSPGYVGRDRFEVFLRVVPRNRAFPTTTRVRVEMTVAP